MSAPAGLAPDLDGLVRVAAALAGGDAAEVRSALQTAARVSEPGEVEEVLLQSLLFLGYPAALNGMAIWREVSGRPAPPPLDEPASRWPVRGERVAGRVYGDQLGALRANVRRMHPELETWMIAEGYGRVLGRPGLRLARRELCIVAILARQGGWVARQLYSHLRGALAAGARPDEVEATLALAAEGAAPEAGALAARVWNEVRGRGPERGPATSPHED